MPFKLYQGDSVIAEGDSPLSVTGLEPNTDVSVGEYEAVRVEDGRESERVTVPAFTTLPINVTGVTLTPHTSSAETGEGGSRQLTATVEPENATNKSVSYSISPETNGLSVSDNGNITWTEETAPGEYTTTVTTADGSHTDTHVLTLTEPEPDDPEEGD